MVEGNVFQSLRDLTDTVSASRCVLTVYKDPVMSSTWSRKRKEKKNNKKSYGQHWVSWLLVGASLANALCPTSTYFNLIMEKNNINNVFIHSYANDGRIKQK